MDDFTLIDAGAVHRAMVEALAQAEERRSLARARRRRLRQHAAQLKVVRDRILDRLPEQWHEYREISYPDYKPVAEKQSVT
jgi:hypothetical protein